MINWEMLSVFILVFHRRLGAGLPGRALAVLAI